MSKKQGIFTVLVTDYRDAVRAIWSRRSQHNLVGNHINIATGDWVYKDAGIGHGKYISCGAYA